MSLPIGSSATQPIPAQVVTFAVYREGAALASGIADVKLPDIGFVTEEVFGAGMTGKLEVVMPLLEAMVATIKWRTVHEDQFTLMQVLQQQGLIFRVAQESYDPGAGGPRFDGVSVRMRAQGKKLTGGSVAPGTATDTEIELAVHYLKMVTNSGKILIEADPVGRVLIVDGVDQLASLRALL
jgi:P2 family phage contractile tail tube protein